MFSKNCPKCDAIITYKLKGDLTFSIKNNTLCRPCSKGRIITPEKLTRSCPNCSKDIDYELRDSYIRAEKINALCNSCKQVGEKNCRYGIPHTIEHREKMSKIMKELKPKRSNSPLPSRGSLDAWSLRARHNTDFCEWCIWTEGEHENLVSHHVLPKGRFPQYALEDWNAMVLCEKHHKQLHSQDGY